MNSRLITFIFAGRGGSCSSVWPAGCGVRGVGSDWYEKGRGNVSRGGKEAMGYVGIMSSKGK